MKYLLMLLFIGLMWGQEYDPETGEVLEKLYNPKTGELIEQKTPLDSIVLPSNSNVNSNLKDISYKDLSKTQKKIYNQNRIRLSTVGSDSPYFFLRDNFWSAYIKKGFFKTKRLNQTEFFEITGYPERVKIIKHNRKLGMSCALFIPSSWLIAPILDIIQPEHVYSMSSIILLGGGFLLFDYFTKIIDGSSFDDARQIVKKYNQDLMVKIYNENN